ncbi:MAG: hypothetical protein A2309_11455 [Bacteroidetes bacterium RIFOXYB2_FULL_35_7]|nr:MAG: hypothetical protein A2309_11455 [Bacteroidetes bacterium RIFOXYB2_FULL_35_7]
MGFSPAAAQTTLNQFIDLFHQERLAQVFQRAHGDGIGVVGFGGVGGNDDHFDRWVGFLDPAQDFETVHAGELPVDESDLIFIFFQLLQGGGAVRESGDLVVFDLQDHLE